MKSVIIYLTNGEDGSVEAVKGIGSFELWEQAFIWW
jgi:hypothetical protein